MCIRDRHGVQRVAHLLGVHPLRQGREPGQIGHQNGQLPLLLVVGVRLEFRQLVAEGRQRRLNRPLQRPVAGAALRFETGNGLH